jgi:hypothetical protein
MRNASRGLWDKVGVRWFSIAISGYGCLRRLLLSDLTVQPIPILPNKCRVTIS